MPPERSGNPIGDRIRKYRKERGLTLPALAEKAEMSKSYLWSLENDSDVRPSGDTLYAIAEALGVTMSDLLGRKLLAETHKRIPKELRDFAMEEGLPESDVQMLASIRFRGEQPRTVERWRFIYQAIKSSRGMDDSKASRVR